MEQNHNVTEGGYRLSKTRSILGSGPLVSIITIVYNGEAFLEKTIKSVLAQSYANIEYIIIDGGSTDSTLDIIKKYESGVAYWKSEPDKGISDAFNKGIAIAQGELVGIINADDWYAPDAVEQIVKCYQPHSVLHGNMQYWNEDGTKGMYVKPNDALLPQEMTLNHPTVFISKSVYLQHGMFSLDYKLSMDYQLLLRLYIAGVSFIHVDKTISNMRSGGFSSNWIKCYQETMKAKNEIIGRKISHHVFYNWQVLRRRISEALANTPLSFINRLYRAYFSTMKKV